MDDLNQNNPSSVITPGPNVWGLCQTPDSHFIFGDCRQKKVHITNKQGSSLLVEKVGEKIQPVFKHWYAVNLLLDL